MAHKIGGSYTIQYLEIEEGTQYLTEADIDKEFVRAKPFQTSYGPNWSYMLLKASENQLKQQAVKLTAELWNLKKDIDNWNDGQWISVLKCRELFKNHSSKMKIVSLVVHDLDV